MTESEAVYPTIFQKIIQANQYTAFILSAQEKQFAIHTTPAVGDYVHKLFTETPANRPQTLDLVKSIFDGWEITPLQLIIHDVSDAIYFCKLFLTQTTGDTKKIVEIDTRPSDGLAIALMYNLPIYCTPTLLSKITEYSDT